MQQEVSPQKKMQHQLIITIPKKHTLEHSES